MSRICRPLEFVFALVLASSACADDPGESSSAPDAGETIEPAVSVELRPLSPVLEHDTATPVSGCLAGGESGLRVSYSEVEPETRERGISFDYDEVLAAVMELPTDPADLDLDLASISDIDGDGQGTVSSTDLIASEISADIPAATTGQWYRMTDQVSFTATIVGLTASGDEHIVGSVTLLDWLFSVQLVLGPSCPPPPPDGYDA